ncbi:Peptidoglycan/LPS O-acetylase OafA/YrhL, contains acyltransferase and SGNH-hydrolase domains [Nocardiopsis flavescens]|uniref:Peptidoglycan/LPS O-acetylase OafA/YrhL, contains acyltransferase and SGNH-hydrolase domains n=1 Tax=Nocardiopsis flavescens TaxID=758803 RepID=A0A1M6LBR0_9ACTN|nr:acyltransferase [Nocardiopsis flavescens]SHJ68636.1 Peptidoglycan/LPS O-acetylase OafA/YrhL, contains acyltransferase and SGNH-hydrolase domains [Nocardiopsis flavescens]
MTTDPRAASARPLPGRRAHLPALDGLRGAAVIGVLLFHTGRLDGGFLGVDLFFVLSGYLITGLLLREAAATGRVDLPAFWGRRLRRLLPALALMLACVTLAVRAVGPPGLVRSTLADGPWVQANLANWHLLASSAGYWDRFGADRVFGHLWSIAVEEQFYLLWPLLVALVALAVGRGNGRGDAAGVPVAALAACLGAASVLAMALLADPADPTRAYTGTDTRAFSLLLGALAAAPPVRDRLARLVERNPRAAAAATAASAAAIAALWLLADGSDSFWLYRGGLLAHALACALLIGLLAHAPGGPMSRALACAPLRWTGGISYSLYLWHWPVIVLLSPEATGLSGWWWTAAVCAVSVALAALSTRLVEDPVRYRARWARGRGGAVAVAAVTVALAALWIAVPAPEPPAVDITALD